MGATSGKLAGGLLLLIGVWVGVYWMWEPSRPPITLDPTGDEPPPPLMNVQRAAPAGTGTPTVARSEVKSPVPAASPAVIPPEFIEYTVQPGDMFESISIKFWKSPKYAGVITRVNGLADAGRLLTPGRTIRLVKDPNNVQGVAAVPPATSPAAPTPQRSTDVATLESPKQGPDKTEPAKQETTKPVVGTRTYVVQSGDSLSKIAKKFYNNSNEWERIYEANRGSMKGPHDLKLGAVLIIPD